MIDYNYLINNIYGELFVLDEPIVRKDGHAFITCRCSCGTVKKFYARKVASGHSKSCGCSKGKFINKNKSKSINGKRFGKLFVLDNQLYNNKILKCKCDCGIIVDINRKDLLRGHINSCGCLHKEKMSKIFSNKRLAMIGKIFGTLTVISFSHSHNHKSLYKVKCECGRESVVLGNNLLNNNTKSCGFCKNRVNGQPISKLQSRLVDILGRGVMNFKSCKKYLDIAFVYKGNKIAIEYDSWYWHKNKIDSDYERVKLLNNNNWKVLSIKSYNSLPTNSQLWNKIEKLVKDSYYEEIIMQDYYSREEKDNVS